MAQVYAISTNKGGVGKTSLVTNMAGVLSRQDCKVLIIDTDGQGNSSMAFNLNPTNFETTIYDVLMGDSTIHEAIHHIDDNLDLIPANDDMNFLEFDILPNLDKYTGPFTLLKEAVDQVRNEYDYIFIDTPPSLGLVAGNVLTCVDKVIIPFIPETFAVKGLIKVIEAINKFKNKENPTLEIEGIVAMMVQSNTVLHSSMLQQARRYCVENDITLFETVIPRSVRFANSTAFEGKPAVWTDANNPIVSAYFELTKEVMQHGKKTERA
ncbi:MULTISPECIES: ParA family protein [Gammaproteobacteria]|uniref:ParA family protein n=1 Tax=Acinetobacter sp. HRXRD-152 TaxID=3404808 RepID=UPI003BB50961